MDKTNLFYDAWLRHGVIVEVFEHSPDVVTVVWRLDKKMWKQQSVQVSKLEVVNGSR